MFYKKYNIIILTCLFLLYIFLKPKKTIFKYPNNYLPSDKKKNILVMFSGGLDSTTALYYLLKETKHNIYAHHVILKDATNRWIDELNACKTLLPLLYDIRSFSYSESTFHLPLNSKDKLGGFRDDDNTTILFIASKIFSVEAYKQIDHIVIGNLDCEMNNKIFNFMNDFINIMYKSKPFTKKPSLINPLSRFNDNKCSFDENNIKKLMNLSNTLKLSENENLEIDIDNFIHLLCTKKKMYSYLPDIIRKNFVYCRYPNKGKTCEKCFNCILYKTII